jgi:hypothetical protein
MDYSNRPLSASNGPSFPLILKAGLTGRLWLSGGAGAQTWHTRNPSLRTAGRGKKCADASHSLQLNKAVYRRSSLARRALQVCIGQACGIAAKYCAARDCSINCITVM